MKLYENRIETAKQNNNNAYMQWRTHGMPEAFDDMNDSNREVIRAYIEENENATGYKFHSGFVNIKEDNTLYNFCCDYVFNGTPENIEKIENAEQAYKSNGKIKDLNALQNALEAADGIPLLWS